MSQDLPLLELRGVSRRFGEVTAVDDVTLPVREGEILTLLGPSGCGKTTILRLVAGFEEPDAGTIRFAGEDVTRRSPQARGFGMVFQNYALFPHLDVAENVGFGLEARGARGQAVSERVERSLERVDLPGFGPRRVQELSGGQQQRVALARALAIEPPLLLLDEPFSNLDAALRERTRTEVRRLVKSLGLTALFVTHDQEEAFDLSDRVAVMKAGRILQVGTPEVLYREPADRFVAGFVGRANVLDVEREGGGGERTGFGLRDGTVWELPASSLRQAEETTSRSRLELLVRPEDLTLEPARGGSPNPPAGSAAALAGVVRERRFRGPVTAYRVELEGGARVEVWGEATAASPGDRVSVRLAPGRPVHLFPADETARGDSKP